MQKRRLHVHHLCVVTAALLGFGLPTCSAYTDNEHGGVAMGISRHRCDDGENGTEIDWDGSSVEYQCPREKRIPVCREVPYKEFCKKKLDKPIHTCLYKKIIYTEHPPTDGPHRPLWPKYGEYKYVPPQRWVHSLEHGAAVFLYHPCAQSKEIEWLKEIARSCLRKHIITPYRFLPELRPFAVVTYGCKLMMSYINEDIIKKFIKIHALKAPEGSYPKDGQYQKELMVHAQIVSDLKDSRICPN